MAQATSTPANAPPAASSAVPGTDVSQTENMVKEALAEAEASLQQIKQDVEGQPLAIPEVKPGAAGGAQVNGIELLGDVELNVTVELGRTQMLVEDVLRLSEGSVVELDKLAGDPVDVYVNNRLIARGEVLVLNDNFCIRISEILADLEEQVEEAAAQQAAHAG